MNLVTVVADCLIGSSCGYCFRCECKCLSGGPQGGWDGSRLVILVFFDVAVFAWQANQPLLRHTDIPMAIRHQAIPMECPTATLDTTAIPSTPTPRAAWIVRSAERAVPVSSLTRHLGVRANRLCSGSRECRGTFNSPGRHQAQPARAGSISAGRKRKRRSESEAAAADSKKNDDRNAREPLRCVST